MNFTGTLNIKTFPEHAYYVAVTNKQGQFPLQEHTGFLLHYICRITRH